MEELITIGLPVYNGMPYLVETVQSLLRQTHRNFLLLVIDDGSVDGSFQYLSSLKDKRIHLIRRKHEGLTATLNFMLEIVESPWLVRHDADDIAYPRRLELTVNAIQRFPDAGMFYSDADYYASGRHIGRFRTTRSTPQGLKAITQSGYLLAICHPTVTLNVAHTRALGGYRSIPYTEDIDLWWRMALKYPLQFIPETLVGVRQNHASNSWNNLELQAINAVYVQSLLLASLSGRMAPDYESLAPVLARLLDRSSLNLKRHLRDMSGHFSNRHYGDTAMAAVRAALSSPIGFARRLNYNLFPKAQVWNGQNPTVLADACGYSFRDSAIELAPVANSLGIKS